MPNNQVGKGRVKWTPVVKQGGSTPAFTGPSFAVVHGFDGWVSGTISIGFTAAGSSGNAISVSIPAEAETTWVCGAGWWFPASGTPKNVVVHIQPFDVGAGDPPNCFQFRVDGTISALGSGFAIASGDYLSFAFGYPIAGIATAPML